MIDTNTGRFVWYELMTRDPQKAMSFYSDVVGWKTQPFDGSNGTYNMWVGSQGPLGGVMQLPEQAVKMGAPPHWIASVRVSDVDAAAAKVKELGGSLHVAPMDMPKIGRYAVIADPQGASISIFTPASDMVAHDSTKHGEFTWRELATTDHVAAFAFYSAIVGWEKLGSHDMGPMGEYLLYGRDGKVFGGMMTKPKDMPMPTAWTYYVQVDDLEAAIARAKAQDARLINGPMDVPGGTRIAMLVDPQGAVFALHAGQMAAPAAAS